MYIMHSGIPDKEIRGFSLGIEILISPMLSHPGVVQVNCKLRPFLETLKFQHIVVLFKGVIFSLKCFKSSDCQSGRLKSFNQRNSNIFLLTDAAENGVETSL